MEEEKKPSNEVPRYLSATQLSKDRVDEDQMEEEKNSSEVHSHPQSTESRIDIPNQQQLIRRRASITPTHPSDISKLFYHEKGKLLDTKGKLYSKFSELYKKLSGLIGTNTEVTNHINELIAEGRNIEAQEVAKKYQQSAQEIAALREEIKVTQQRLDNQNIGLNDKFNDRTSKYERRVLQSVIIIGGILYLAPSILPPLLPSGLATIITPVVGGALYILAILAAWKIGNRIKEKHQIQAKELRDKIFAPLASNLAVNLIQGNNNYWLTTKNIKDIASLIARTNDLKSFIKKTEQLNDEFAEKINTALKDNYTILIFLAKKIELFNNNLINDNNAGDAGAYHSAIVIKPALQNLLYDYDIYIPNLTLRQIEDPDLERFIQLLKSMDPNKKYNILPRNTAEYRSSYESDVSKFLVYDVMHFIQNVKPNHDIDRKFLVSCFDHLAANSNMDNVEKIIDSLTTFNARPNSTVDNQTIESGNNLAATRFN